MPLLTIPDSAFTIHVTRTADNDDADLSYYTPEEGAERYEGDPEAEKYLAEDAARIAAYWRGSWEFVAVHVRAMRNGVELGRASLHNIESDSGPEYFAEIERDLTADAIAQARETLVKLVEGLT